MAEPQKCLVRELASERVSYLNPSRWSGILGERDVSRNPA